jgi:hypothetical protein
MPAELYKTDRNSPDTPGGTLNYSPLREMLGYDPKLRRAVNL